MRGVEWQAPQAQHCHTVQGACLSCNHVAAVYSVQAAARLVTQEAGDGTAAARATSGASVLVIGLIKGAKWREVSSSRPSLLVIEILELCPGVTHTPS
jgi:hypothetical protein